MKKCECGYAARPGRRYCKVCETKIRIEMKRARYLTPEPHNPNPRGMDARENVLETRHGVDS